MRQPLYLLLYTDYSPFLPLSLESTSSGRDLVSHLLPLNPARDTNLTIGVKEIDLAVDRLFDRNSLGRYINSVAALIY